MIEVNGIRSAEGAIVVAIFDQEQVFKAVDISASDAVSFLPATASSIQMQPAFVTSCSLAKQLVHPPILSWPLLL
ncbi:MAG: hypothetical protein AAF718_10745 [Pseudomonadota bacterium]